MPTLNLILRLSPYSPQMPPSPPATITVEDLATLYDIVGTTQELPPFSGNRYFIECVQKEITTHKNGITLKEADVIVQYRCPTGIGALDCPMKNHKTEYTGVREYTEVNENQYQKTCPADTQTNHTTESRVVDLYPLTPDEESRLDSAFTYHPPKPGQTEKYIQLRDLTKSLAKLYMEFCPRSRELSIALTHLEEANMSVNAGIARNE